MVYFSKATKSLSGEVVHTLRLAVALRRKVQVRQFHIVENHTIFSLMIDQLMIIVFPYFFPLQIYYWKNREFHELRADLSLSDTPKV